jgi:hypothetical protein
MTAEREKLIDQAAQAEWRRLFPATPLEWFELGEGQEIFRAPIKRAIAAIEAHGVALVPKEQTREMHVALFSKKSGVGIDYSAMLAASPYAPSNSEKKNAT